MSSLEPLLIDFPDISYFDYSGDYGLDDDFGTGFYPLDFHRRINRAPRIPIFQSRHMPYTTAAAAAAVAAAASINATPSTSGSLNNGSHHLNSNNHHINTPSGSGLLTKKHHFKSKADCELSCYSSLIGKEGFQVSMNVQQFKPNELTVKVIDNNIMVEGDHEEREDIHGLIARHFIRKFVLPKGYDSKDVVSMLSSDGVLTIKASPPQIKQSPKIERIVHIQHTGPAAISIKNNCQFMKPMMNINTTSAPIPVLVSVPIPASTAPIMTNNNLSPTINIKLPSPLTLSSTPTNTENTTATTANAATAIIVPTTSTAALVTNDKNLLKEKCENGDKCAADDNEPISDKKIDTLID